MVSHSENTRGGRNETLETRQPPHTHLLRPECTSPLNSIMLTAYPPRSNIVAEPPGCGGGGRILSDGGETTAFGAGGAMATEILDWLVERRECRWTANEDAATPVR